MTDYLSKKRILVLFSSLLWIQPALRAAKSQVTIESLLESNTSEYILQPLDTITIERHVKKLQKHNRLLPILKAGSLSCAAGILAFTGLNYAKQYTQTETITQLWQFLKGAKIKQSDTRKKPHGIQRIKTWLSGVRKNISEKRLFFANLRNYLQSRTTQSSTVLIKNMVLPILGNTLAQSITAAMATYLPLAEIFNQKLSFAWFIKTQTQYAHNIDIYKRALTELSTTIDQQTQNSQLLYLQNAAQGIIHDLEKIIAFLKIEQLNTQGTEKLETLRSLEQVVTLLAEQCYQQTRGIFTVFTQDILNEAKRQTCIPDGLKTIAYLELFGNKLLTITSIPSPWLPSLLNY